MSAPGGTDATSVEPDEGPDTYFMKANRLGGKLATVKEPVTDQHFKDIIVQGLPENYRQIKFIMYKDLGFNLTNIQATMRHLYLDGLSRKKTIAPHRTIMTAATA